MSRQGWRDFLEADGVDDWVVLYGGPAAAYAVTSLGAATALAAALGEVPGLIGSGALLTLGESWMTVRLARRGDAGRPPPRPRPRDLPGRPGARGDRRSRRGARGAGGRVRTS